MGAQFDDRLAVATSWPPREPRYWRAPGGRPRPAGWSPHAWWCSCATAWGSTTWPPAPCPRSALDRDGTSKQVKAVMPTVTNANNTSICSVPSPRCTGSPGTLALDPAAGRRGVHGIGGAGAGSDALPAGRRGGRTIGALDGQEEDGPAPGPRSGRSGRGRGPQAPICEALGEAPKIYSREINYWCCKPP